MEIKDHNSKLANTLYIVQKHNFNKSSARSPDMDAIQLHLK